MSVEVIGNDNLMEGHACSKGWSDGPSEMAKQKCFGILKLVLFGTLVAWESRRSGWRW
jgi:hypothetical protein